MDVDVKASTLSATESGNVPKHIGSSEKIDGVALSRSRLCASTRGFELVAHRSTDRIDKIRMIYALCGQANAFCREAPQKCASTFIDGRNIENKMYWQGLSGDGLTIR